jgi:HD superfamily phosphohydrolase
MPQKSYKIINDPVHGFIRISHPLVFRIIEHPYFQRLRRIKQLGLTEYVYPGALHTRFHHALGAYHLMGIALDTLRSKGVPIHDEEALACQIAILLHDVGHGPFSHALEYTILEGVHHEQLSLLIMQKLNEQFHNALELAIRIFCNEYERPFFHQLVSSQLDMDRLDYLQRDCYFTGVQEGTIGAARLLKMIDVVNDELVVEEKGIYSIENFLTARRVMYWQVYLHKTTIATEQMIVQIMRRAKELTQAGQALPCTPALAFFLRHPVQQNNFYENEAALEAFTSLDDYDIWAAIKQWTTYPDYVLSELSRRLLERRLFKVKLSPEKLPAHWVEEKKKEVLAHVPTSELLPYFFIEGSTENTAYQTRGGSIRVLRKNGKLTDIAEASDLPNIKALKKMVKKYYVCWAKYN